MAFCSVVPVAVLRGNGISLDVIFLCAAGIVLFFFCYLKKEKGIRDEFICFDGVMGDEHN